MPRGIPASGTRKRRTTNRRTTGGSSPQLGAQFWNQVLKTANTMLQLHQKHGGQQTRARGRGGRAAGTGNRATGARQRKARIAA